MPYQQDGGLDGYQNIEGGTSEAAIPKDTKTIRAQVLAILEQYPTMGMTPDQCADRLGLDILTVRPRFTELKNQGKIEATGATRASKNGKQQKVWRLKND